MMSFKNHRKVIIKFFGPARMVLALSVMGLSMLIANSAWAQVTGGTLSGTLTDPTGAVIPQGHLAITNVATGVNTTAITNADGFYTAANLIPGDYEMTATASGFAPQKRTGITLEVGAQLVQNFALKVGKTTQQVEVTSAQAPEIEHSSSTIGAVVGSAAVVDLPLNGRSWQDLAALEPGVVAATTQLAFDNISNASSRASRGVGNEASIGGARPGQNNYRLDGVSVNDFSNGPIGNMSGGDLGVDAIQEFSVLTSNYSAEYGKASGGVINAVTRSGSNRIHGSAYEFVRNSALDARNYFDGPTIPPFQRNQYGTSIGGPIRKDRTFFFADYEGLSQSKGVTVVNIVPSAAARAGNLCSAPSSPACSPNTITVDPAAQAYLPFYPLPNAGLLTAGNGDTGFFNFPESQITSDQFFTARIDHQIAGKDHIDGTYQISRSPFTLPDNFNNVTLGYRDNAQVYALEETHAFSANLVNSVRIGTLRQYATANELITAQNQLATNTSLNYASGFTAPQVKINGLASFSGGANSFGFAKRGFTTFQIYDDATWVRGTHSVKFGFAGERQYTNIFSVPTAGVWSYNTNTNSALKNFLLNAAGATFQAPELGNPSLGLAAPPGLGFSNSIIGGYVQDDWHWKPNVTLNLGLRYEMLTDPTEKHGYIATLPTLTSATVRTGNPLFLNNPTLHNFEPRVGFAWDPFRDGKTSVRSGFGIFDSLPMSYEFSRTAINVYPFGLQYTATNLPQGAFYNNGVASKLTAATATVLYNQPNPSRSYVMQWNLNVQRELARDLTLTVGYAGTRGVHLKFNIQDIDNVTPTLTSAGWLYPNPVKSGTRINTNFGNILYSDFSRESTYHALELRVNKRMSHGFQIQGSYTWGKSLDNASNTLSNNDFSNSITGLDPFGNLTRGPSDFNVDRTLVINGLWQLPEAKALPKFAQRVTNGWQLGAIYKVADGVPFTPTFGTGGNPSGQNGSNTRGYPNRLGGPGCHTAINKGNPKNYINLNCFSLPTAPDMAFWQANCDTTSKIYGSPATVEPYPICLNLRGNSHRNSLVGPGLSDLDFSVFKNNKIGEIFNLQFRTEAFNILNRTNFAAPPTPAGTDLYSSTGVANSNGTAGLLTGTTTTSREIQFAVKLIW